MTTTEEGGRRRGLGPFGPDGPMYRPDWGFEGLNHPHEMCGAPVLFFERDIVPLGVRLTTRGTFEDIAKLPDGLKEVLEVMLIDAELSTTGVVTWGEAEGIWVAIPTWDVLKR
jgi:hypothetical protein